MMRVGFGVSALCKGLAGGGLHGIGHYTREMLARFNGHGSIEHGQPDPAIKLVPFAFGCPVPPGLTGDAGVQLGRYSVNAARSVLTGANFLGIDRLAKQVDLIHATDHYVPRCKSVPIVATLMDAIPLSHPQWLRSEWRAVKNMLWKRAANWADSVITISDYSKVELSRWAGIPLERITVIPLAVDDRWFHDVSQTEFERVRAQYALPNHFFVSVGTLQPRKNVETTIRAHRALTAAERQRTPLLIIGRAGWKCEAVMRLIEESARQADEQGKPGRDCRCGTTHEQAADEQQQAQTDDDRSKRQWQEFHHHDRTDQGEQDNQESFHAPKTPLWAESCSE